MASNIEYGAPMDRVEVEISTPHGPLKGALGVPPGPMRLAELAMNAVQISTAASRMAEKAAEAAGKPVSCCKGCGACCRQLVAISPAEAFMLADLIEMTPEPRRSSLRERFAETEKKLRDSGMWDKVARLNVGDLPEDEHRAITREYFEMQVPCPFLENEECSIHPLRPSICREISVTSPAENCKAPFDKPIEPVDVTTWVNVALARVSAHALGTEPRFVSLSTALAWVEENKEGASLAAEARELMELFIGNCGLGYRSEEEDRETPGEADSALRRSLLAKKDD